jgi:monofunctional biosynthetic peptidoglycan transglycosylase
VSALVAVFLVQALLVLSLRWVDPPTTAFMAANPEGAIQESVRSSTSRATSWPR